MFTINTETSSRPVPYSWDGEEKTEIPFGRFVCCTGSVVCRTPRPTQQQQQRQFSSIRPNVVVVVPCPYETIAHIYYYLRIFIFEIQSERLGWGLTMNRTGRFHSPDRRLRYSCVPTWFHASKRSRLKRWASTGSWVRTTLRCDAAMASVTSFSGFYII